MRTYVEFREPYSVLCGDTNGKETEKGQHIHIYVCT